MKKRNFWVWAVLCIGVFASCRSASDSSISKRITLTREQLFDKIKGGWVGQTIGCTYGGPTEFKYRGCIIPDSVSIDWPDGCVKWYYDNFPGLYDDVYMDLTFVEVFDRLGLDAPVDSFAVAFARAGYPLWHANQSARYNILNGIMPPESGHWLNNPHADCIDYQIEADFAGLMSPGMPNTASAISDKIGHIMNYGNGWYGGVYVGAMYAMAFVTDDIETIVSEGLKTIPAESDFYACMADVIAWHKQYPDDWKKTWQACEEKYGREKGCPEGVFCPLNIDALINSAYITIGLLYGQGDFFKTMDISTRCGQDSDCNPASAIGILGTMIGYDRIPEKWIKNVKEVEDRDLAYTTISLNKAYRLSLEQALQVIERNGGQVDEDRVTIVCQQPEPVRFEAAFSGLVPKERIAVNKSLNDNPVLRFDGSSFVMCGYVQGNDPEYTAEMEVYIDGERLKTMSLPVSFTTRSNELCWKYGMPDRQHEITFKWLNPNPNASVCFTDALIYTGDPSVKEKR